MSKKKQQIESEIIGAWSKLFDLYPELNCLPVYAWGRYYKYECSGEPFERYLEYGEGFYGTFVYGVSVEDERIQTDLLKRIDEEYDQDRLEAEGIGDYIPNRKDVVYHFGGDNGRGGECILIIRTPEGLVLDTAECDSPE